MIEFSIGSRGGYCDVSVKVESGATEFECDLGLLNELDSIDLADTLIDAADEILRSSEFDREAIVRRIVVVGLLSTSDIREICDEIDGADQCEQA